MKSYLLATGLKPDESEYISANLCDDPTANRADVLIEEDNAPATYVGHSFISGLGLFAARDISAGELVVDYGMFPKNWYQLRYDQLSEEQIAKNWYVMTDTENCITSDKWSKFSYINHSREPNCDWLTQFKKIVSNKLIPKGTELFIDYRKEPKPSGIEYPEWI